jgi:hypothetical protein
MISFKEFSQFVESSCKGRREWVQPELVGGGPQQRHLTGLKANQSPIRGFLLPRTASNPSEVLCVGMSQLASVVIRWTLTGM